MTEPSLRVLVLMPGPKFDLDWEFETRLAGLSTFASGYVITSSQPARALEIGRFKVVAPFFWPESVWSVLKSRISFVRECLRALRESKREGRPIDLVVAYDPLLTGLVGWCLARRCGARLICEVNGDYGDDANFVHVRSALMRRIKRAAAVRLARFVLRRCSGIRLLHGDQLTKLDYESRAGQIVRQIPEFVPVDAFRDLGESETVLLLGFPFFVKGVDIAIAAFKRVSPRFPSWKMIIMGYYPDQAELDAAIAGDPAIEHRQPELHRNVPAQIGRCGILLQPSRSEAMGRVLIEAMACAKPRIASRVGGIPTVVEHGIDGLLVDSGDIDGFEQALAMLMAHPEQRRSMGAAGAARAHDEFSVANYMKRTARFYGEVAAAT